MLIVGLDALLDGRAVGLFGRSIPSLKRKRDVEGLVSYLASEHPQTRRSAAEALGEIGDPAAVGPLVEALKVSILAGRAEVVAATRRVTRGRLWMPGSEFWAAVGNAGSEYDGEIQWAMDALKAIGSDAVGPLVKLLRDEVLGDYAVTILARIGEPAVAPLTHASKKSKSEQVRLRADSALERIEKIARRARGE